MDGVTWARRQRTRIQAINGFRRVWVRTFRRVSRVRWVVQGLEGDGVERLPFVAIFLGVDIAVLVLGEFVSLLVI